VIKSRRMRRTRHVLRARENRKSCTISVGIPEGKRALERGRRRWKGSVKIGLKDIEWKNVDLIYLTQVTEKWRAAAKTVLNFSVLQNAGRL